MTKQIAETTLSPPVASYFRERGYTVHAEVLHCDLLARRGEEVVAIELKRSLNIEVLAQAVRRQALANHVYIAVSRPKCVGRGGRWRAILQLLRRLELGLLWVDVDKNPPKVEERLAPSPYTPRRQTKSRRRALHEAESRSVDLNIGGSTKRKLMTAYRENALRIAFLLAQHGPISAKRLRELGTDEKTWSTLHRNLYGWFARHTPGVYGLTDSGYAALALYPELVVLWAERGT
ncbi:MAG: hypothetical protein DDT37_00471 [Firmicutes bacterium]|nr:hypothetical protein [candidate division NPL-UPA2 bacterium]